MKLLLYPHGGSGNHGCEAIVRSTLKMIPTATLFSSNPDEDKRYGLDAICTLRTAQAPMSHLSLAYWKAFIRYRFGDKEAFDRTSFRSIFQEANSDSYALSIGGDNYCYGVPVFIYLVNKQLRKQGIKTILWGCSVEPEVLRGDILNDLRSYTHIFARESITYEAMKEKGIQQLSLFPDPAFQLNRTDLTLPEGFAEGNTVGINVSPMIIKHEKAKGMTLLNYRQLIRYIIATTDMQIALIPHVVWNYNDDRIPLQFLYNEFKGTGRVVLIEDHNAEELKGFISRCRFLVASRTHASIAAYSTQIPTLVMGYSVKARGIARDLFGNEEHYVLPVQSLQQGNDLLKAFQWLQTHEDEIRKHYRTFMPGYLAKTFQAGQLLQTL